MHLLSLCQCLRQITMFSLLNTNHHVLFRLEKISGEQLQPTWDRAALMALVMISDDLTQGTWHGSNTRPPLKPYRNPCSPSCVLNANCVAEHCHFPQHSCKTRKKQRNQAPGIPHHCAHEKWCLATTQPFSPAHPACFYLLSGTAIPFLKLSQALTGMSREMR